MATSPDECYGTVTARQEPRVAGDRRLEDGELLVQKVERGGAYVRVLVGLIRETVGMANAHEDAIHTGGKDGNQRGEAGRSGALTPVLGAQYRCSMGTSRVGPSKQASACQRNNFMAWLF
jgi:hypothetical protein